LKVYAESRPELAGRVSITAEDHQVSRETASSLKGIADAILADEPDMVGFSCYMWNIIHILKLCALLKSAAPRLRIVLGGPEVAPRGEDLLRELPEIDFVCFEEEGEQTFAELLVRLVEGRDPSGVKGLLWRRDGEVVRETPMPLLDDLDLIPSPYLTGAIGLRGGDTVIIETSRGCPYGCKFCDYPRGTTRNFSVRRALDEIAAAQKQADNLMFFFSDADIFTELPRAKELVRGLRQLGEKRSDLFLIPGYLARLDEETFELLNSESFVLCAGVQSMNTDVLKSIARFFSKDKLERGVRLWKEKAPRCCLNFHLIFGLPGETIESFRAGVQWALDLRITQLWIFRVNVMPGTALGKNPDSYGLTAEKDPPYRVLSTASATALELDEFERWSCVFRILNDLRLVSDMMAGLAVEVGVKSLVLWDEFIEEALRAPAFGLEQAYRDSDPFDNGFSLAAKRWTALARESGLLERMHDFALEFSRRKLREAGKEAREPALGGVRRPE
jgi:radical SAM superfamily enzyme YgiQ (UPF0313 family)